MKKIITGKVRGSYVNIFKPRYNELSNKEEYSMVALIPKTDKKTVEKIKRIVDLKRVEKFGQKMPVNFRHPLRDGDAEKEGDPAYKNHYFVTLKSSTKVGIVDWRLEDVLDPSAFLSGDYCRVSMIPYSYDVSGNRGVGFGLGNIQVLEKGEPLASHSRPEDDFEEWEEIEATSDTKL